MGYLDTKYVVNIQLRYKKLFRFENCQSLVFSKFGFHGDTFVAREHNTNGMFPFFTKI